MTTPLEAMKAALEALDDATYLCQMYGSIGRREQAERWQLDYPAHYDKAMKAKLNLRTAIAQLERTDHIKVTRAAWTGNTTYSCKYCGDDFRSQHQAAAHQCGKMPAKIAQLESAEPVGEIVRFGFGNAVLKQDPIASFANGLPPVGAKLYTHPPAAIPPDVVRDAERYRWLRDKGTGPCQIWETVCEPDGTPLYCTLKHSENLDAAIDAAMQQEQPKCPPNH